MEVVSYNLPWLLMDNLLFHLRNSSRLALLSSFPISIPESEAKFFRETYLRRVGLNLTAADYVIHLDPWWNPAVEMQASDRAHHIGQDKPVFVYKLIARDTVEEKILQLQEKKRVLVKNLISTEASFFKSLTRDDVKDLFS